MVGKILFALIAIPYFAFWRVFGRREIVANDDKMLPEGHRHRRSTFTRG